MHTLGTTENGYLVILDNWDEVTEGVYSCYGIRISKNGETIKDEEFINKIEELFDTIDSVEEFLNRVEEETNWYEYCHKD